jgi:hypothetical protein
MFRGNLVLAVSLSRNVRLFGGSNQGRMKSDESVLVPVTFEGCIVLRSSPAGLRPTNWITLSMPVCSNRHAAREGVTGNDDHPTCYVQAGYRSRFSRVFLRQLPEIVFRHGGTFRLSQAGRPRSCKLMGVFVIHLAFLLVGVFAHQQGHFASRKLLRFTTTTGPSVTLSSSIGQTQQSS